MKEKQISKNRLSGIEIMFKTLKINGHLHNFLNILISLKQSGKQIKKIKKM